jgi:hypothetical protein
VVPPGEATVAHSGQIERSRSTTLVESCYRIFAPLHDVKEAAEPERALLDALGEFSPWRFGPAEPYHSQSSEKRTEAQHNDWERE